MAAGITKEQIKVLWAVARKLNMKKDDLYSACGVEHLHDLSVVQADKIIKRLSDSSKHSKPYYEVPGMITQGQQRKIWRLMYLLNEYSPSTAKVGSRLCGIIKKELKINVTSKKPFVWIDRDAGNKLIEVLKSYVESAKKKACPRG